MQHELAQLSELATNIQGIIADGKEKLARSDAEQWQALSLVRFQLLRALNLFIQVKDDKFLIPFSASGDVLTAGVARIIRERNQDLQKYYDSFVQRWLLLNPLSVSEFYISDAKITGTLISQTVESDMISIRRMCERAQKFGDYG